MTRRFLVLLALSLGLMRADATQIVHESLESVLQKSRAAVVVEVTSVSEPRVDGYWQNVDFQARSIRTLFGDRQPAQRLACRYAQGLPHRRGDMAVSPLITGSGLEFRLKKGDQVIVLIGAREGATEVVDVLRVEPLSSEPAIQKHQKSGG
jgi:argonaute-like protein implicated in RNA metabolism and viral defense